MKSHSTILVFAALAVTGYFLKSLGSLDQSEFTNKAENFESAEAIGSSNISSRVNTSVSRLSNSETSSLNRSIQQAIELGNSGRNDQAARILADLYAGFESYTSEEKLLLLERYSSLLVQLGSHAEAIVVLKDLLDQPSLPEETELYALQTIGGSLMEQEEWTSASEYIELWLGLSTERDSDLLYDLSYTYYKQALWSEAIPPAIEHINLLQEEEGEITRERLMYLASLAYSAQDLENAAWVLQVMVAEFNEIGDWRNLMAIYDTLGDETAKSRLLRDAEEAGVIEELEDLIAPRDRRSSRRSRSS